MVGSPLKFVAKIRRYSHERIGPYYAHTNMRAIFRSSNAYTYIVHKRIIVQISVVNSESIYICLFIYKFVFVFQFMQALFRMNHSISDHNENSLLENYFYACHVIDISVHSLQRKINGKKL